jgi:beta-glucosidase
VWQKNRKLFLRVGMKKLLLLLLASIPLTARELLWDWRTINMDAVKFPANFVWGVAVAEYQVSGGDNSQWAQAARLKTVPACGTACDSYNRMDEDIACIKKLGVKSFRFSVGWDRIEPVEGKFDEEVIAHYQTFCDKLLAAGIEPMVTLHHFVHPNWFEKKGGFEKTANLKYFLRFALRTFDALKDKVRMWITINEPGPYVFESYLRGVWPPHKTMAFHLGGHVMANLLRAHVMTYTAIKSLPEGANMMIGFAHSVTYMDPYHDYQPMEKAVCSWFNHYFHDAVTKFFKTGIFHWSALPHSVHMEIPNAKKSLDFVGLNYYANVKIALGPTNFGAPAYRKGDIPTDMPYGLYPEGMYRAIQDLSHIGVPIYITETGLADAKDNRRAQMIRSYAYAISKAIADGYDVRGCYYWSLLDNYEWAFGYTKKFGLYEVDMKTKERKLRAGAQAYIDLVAKNTVVA